MNTQTASLLSSEQSRKKSPHFYRPELDILRFIAFTLVFAGHAVPISLRPSLLWRVLRASREAGAFGVCLFFMLSSYLITELLFRELDKTGDIHIRSFYMRRILRIWPLYFAMLFFGYIFGRVNPAYGVSEGRLAAFLHLTGNWYTARFGFGHNLIFQLWSISLEEQFYLIWPTIARFGRRIGVFIASIVFWLGAYVVLIALCKQHANLNSAIWANSFVQFQYFSIGAMLALFLKGRIPELSASSRFILFITGLAVLFLADFVFHIRTTTTIPNIRLTLPGFISVGLGVIMLFFSLLGTSVPRSAEPLVYLGKISFGLYVFHATALEIGSALVDRFNIHNVFARVSVVGAVSFVFTVLLAMLSYRYLESPFLRLKERFTLVRTRNV